jgi:hypothetical protein
MKIIRNDQTAIEAKQGRFTGIFIGIVFAGIGSAMAYTGIVKPSGVATNSVTIFLIMGIIFTLTGLGLILFSNKVHVLADRTAQTIDINKRSLVRNASMSCKFADVSRIDEVTSVNHSSGPHGGTTVQTTMQIILKDGTIIPLPDDHSSNFSLNGFRLGAIATRKDFAQSLANFIGVPFTPYGSQPLGQVLNSVMQSARSIGEAPVAPTTVMPQAAPTPPQTANIPSTPPPVTQPQETEPPSTTPSIS